VRELAPVASRVSLLVFIFASLQSAAQDGACPDRSNAEPAQLIDSDVQKRRVSNLSPPWRGDEQFRFTWFSGYVGVDGRLDRICCYSSSKQISSSESGDLREKLKDLRFTPASHDGEKLEAYVTFTIIGVKTGSGLESRLFLNQLRSKEEFGIDYIAPQRIGLFGAFSSSRIRGEYALDIDERGIPSNARITQWHTGSDGARDGLLDHVSQKCFIPGKVNDQPVAMPYFEVIQRS
jgi:hypothetical protein